MESAHTENQSTMHVGGLNIKCWKCRARISSQADGGDCSKKRMGTGQARGSKKCARMDVNEDNLKDPNEISVEAIAQPRREP